MENNNRRLWTYAELCADLALAPSAIESLNQAEFDSVWIYPRGVKKGTLYIHYVKGAANLSLINEALDKGAVVLTSEDPTKFRSGAPIIRVASISEAIRKLGAVGRNRCIGDAIAITGSVGKSSTKDMTSCALSALASTHAKVGNENGELGINTILACTPPNTRFSVLEVSATGPGTISPRVAPIRPTVGIVLNAAFSHGASYSDESEIVHEKLSLLDNLIGRRLAIVGRELFEKDRADKNFLREKNIDRLLLVGRSADDAVRLKEIRATAVSSLATIEIGGDKHRAGREYEVELLVPGRHFVESAMFAMAVAYGLGLDLDLAARACSNFRPPARRTERMRVDLGGRGKLVELIDDSANASPTSVRALLDLIRERPEARRRVLVFGDMRELGPDEEAHHISLADDVTSAGVDLLVTVGPLSHKLGQHLEGCIEVLSYTDAIAAANELPEVLHSGDLIALKASAGTNLIVVVNALTSNRRHSAPAGAWTIEDEIAS